MQQLLLIALQELSEIKIKEQRLLIVNYALLGITVHLDQQVQQTFVMLAITV